MLQENKYIHDSSPAKEQGLQIMKERIERSLYDAETRAKVESDFNYTFQQLGLSEDEARTMCTTIFNILVSQKELPEIETEVLSLFESTVIGSDGESRDMVEVLHGKLRDRAKTICSQIAPHLGGISGRVIDYGAGDGQVTQLLHDELSLNIVGVDVRGYKGSQVAMPIEIFDGRNVAVPDQEFEAAVLTNVLHHERENEHILDELDRIVAHKLIILETVPVGGSNEEMEADKERTFMNDYLYNRLFHNADIPVPGTYETHQRWVERFAQHGWKLTVEQDLGFDQPTIKDRHYLLIFEKGKETGS